MNLEEDEDIGKVQSLWKTKPPNPKDFEIGRPGDHLICPFLAIYVCFISFNEWNLILLASKIKY